MSSLAGKLWFTYGQGHFRWFLPMLKYDKQDYPTTVLNTLFRIIILQKISQAGSGAFTVLAVSSPFLCVISFIVRNCIFSRLTTVKNTVLLLVTLRSSRFIPSYWLCYADIDIRYKFARLVFSAPLYAPSVIRIVVSFCCSVCYKLSLRN